MTISREGSEIFHIPEIGEVTQDDAACKLQTIKNAIIVGVVQLDSCFCCKARVEPLTPPMVSVAGQGIASKNGGGGGLLLTKTFLCSQ